MVDMEADYTLSFTYDKSKLQNPYISRAVLAESGRSVIAQVGMGKNTVFATAEMCIDGEKSVMKLTLGTNMYQDSGSTDHIHDFSETAFARRISHDFRYSYDILEYVETTLRDRALFQNSVLSKRLS